MGTLEYGRGAVLVARRIGMGLEVRVAPEPRGRVGGKRYRRPRHVVAAEASEFYKIYNGDKGGDVYNDAARGVLAAKPLARPRRSCCAAARRRRIAMKMNDELCTSMQRSHVATKIYDDATQTSARRPAAAGGERGCA
jgi:hypothetical protein